MVTKLKNISYSGVVKSIMFVLAIWMLTIFCYNLNQFYVYDEKGVGFDYNSEYQAAKTMYSFDKENGTDYYQKEVELANILKENLVDLEKVAILVDDKQENTIQDLWGLDIEDFRKNGLEFYIVDNESDEIIGKSNLDLDTESSNVTKIRENIQSEILFEGDLNSTINKGSSDYDERKSYNYISSEDVNTAYLSNIEVNDNTEVNYHDYYLYVMYTDENIVNQITNYRVALRDEAMDVIINLTISSIMFICIMVYFTLVAGRRPNNDEINIKKIDNIYLDVVISIWSLFIMLFTLLLMVWIQEFNFSEKEVILLLVVYSSISTASTVFTFTNLSIKIKAKKVLDSLMCFVFIRFIYRKTIKVAYRFLIKETTLSLKVLLVLGIFFGFISIAAPILSVFIIVLYFAHLFVSIKLVKAIKDVANNEKFVADEKLRNIPYNSAFQQLEAIGKNTNEVYIKGLKAQNTKTELITNVSHDLRTPLTSLVGYIDLLDKRGNDYDNETQEYIRILKEKSNRMTQMVGDLFDLAKTSSGDVELDMSKLNVKKLIEQTLAELDDVVLDESKIQLDLDEKLNILADGNKMYRVIQNLIDNALKYSLTGTRIYIVAFKNSDEEVQIEFKNIANYEMNFNCDDIRERFTRGDKSRTKEGSGLGLAIAETYTNLNSGIFEVKVDGDLFKAIIRFKNY